MDEFSHFSEYSKYSEYLSSVQPDVSKQYPQDKKFKFKIKIIQTDLMGSEFFFNMIAANYASPTFPLMSQNSSYISKLNFINNYEGGTVVSQYKQYDNDKRETSHNSGVNMKKQKRDEIGNNVFRITVANPEIAEEIKVKKEKILKEKFADSINLMQMQFDEFQQAKNEKKDKQKPKSNADKPPKAVKAAEIVPTESAFEDMDDDNIFMDMDLDDVDILASLNAFEELNDYNSDEYTEDENGEFDGFDEFDENGEYNDGYEEDDFEYFENFESVENFMEEPNVSSFMNNSKLEINFDTTGSIKFLSDNLLEVKYDDSEITGINNSYVRFLFDMNNKGFVSIHKGANSDIWLDCEKGRRISRQKGNGRYGYVATINTKELINKMTPDGGQIFIQYIRETNGNPAEMVSHSLSVVPSGDE